MSVWGYDTDVGPTSVYHFHRYRCSTYAFDMERASIGLHRRVPSGLCRSKGKATMTGSWTPGLGSAHTGTTRRKERLVYLPITSHRGEQAMAVAKHASAMISPNSVMSRDAVHA